MSLPPQRILVFRSGCLGDHLVALPAYWALREAFPQAHITLMSEEPLDPNHVTPPQFVPQQLLFDAFSNYPTARSSRSPWTMLKFAWSLRQGHYDLLVYLGERQRTHPVIVARDLRFFRLTGLGKVIGHRGGEALPAEYDGRDLRIVRNETENLLARLVADGVTPPRRGNDWLALTEGEHFRAKTWLQKEGITSRDRSRCLAIGVGGKLPSKIWPEERFAEVGRNLIQQYDILPIVFGGSADVALGQRLCQGWGRGRVGAGALDVRTAVAAMEGMLGYFGNDTGTMHMAAVAGLRCVGLFTPMEWSGRWVPLGKDHLAVRTSRLPDCNDCGSPDCKCLHQISVEQAYEACLDVCREGMS